ncbi:hypothetical protein COY26_03890 [Candidatus Woesearchaeota archaeon CG_4_10_14_0_2_um_filter_33_10]|nr:MAG: hypothetical protein COV14_04740 [Candidatus Woesearchaeota archaeon CG10_big_fil_rev_8_21_14_0_10_33_12]PIU73046.1 MAG: hypothetical protein COS79_00360 [Candidatus Woesearchaeota archaeon CG06_land_8_20_14_3_00_33_13]PIZ52691.1 MAG: hypothetical protein COY26_03890 [Candidatus Woesearchaeota archaeon CG_4_10_14_0_2_um_filter_33_10]
MRLKNQIGEISMPYKKICMKCGAELEDDENICPKCGAKYREEEAYGIY